MAAAIGYAFSGLGSAYDDDDPFTLLLLEECRDRWERVGVIKTDNNQVPDTRKGGLCEAYPFGAVKELMELAHRTY